jgi:hypothetical protein
MNQLFESKKRSSFKTSLTEKSENGVANWVRERIKIQIY